MESNKDQSSIGSSEDLTRQKAKKQKIWLAVIIIISILAILLIGTIAYSLLIFNGGYKSTLKTEPEDADKPPQILKNFEVSSCTIINQPGKYFLTRDISSGSNDTDCITINSSYVQLDCHGHTIIHSKTGIISSGTFNNYNGTIEFNSNNSIIQNCNLYNNLHGIRIDIGGRYTLSNINASNNSIGVYSYLLYNSLIYNINANYNHEDGISLTASDNTKLSNINANNNFRGVMVSTTDDNLLENINLEYNTVGLVIGAFTYNATLNNINSSYNRDGILLMSDNSTISNIFAYHNNKTGISLQFASNNVFNNVNIEQTGWEDEISDKYYLDTQGYLDDKGHSEEDYVDFFKYYFRIGLYFSQFSNNNLLSNINLNDNVNGVVLDNSHNNTLSYINAVHNSESGISIRNSENNTFDNINDNNNGNELELIGFSLNNACSGSCGSTQCSSSCAT